MMGKILEFFKNGTKNLFRSELVLLLRNKKNLISLLILGIIILAIPLGTDLLRRQQILKSRAAADPIVFVASNDVFRKSDGTWVTKIATVSVQLTSPLDPPPSSPNPSSNPSSNPSPSSSPVASAPGSTPTSPQNFRATCNNAGSATLNWDTYPGAESYTLRFNKDPAEDWTGAKDFAVSLAGSATSFTTGTLTNPVTSVCSWGTNHDDQHCTSCANQQPTCTTTGVASGISGGVHYGVSIEANLSGNAKSQRSVADINCPVLPLPQNTTSSCNNGSVTLSWSPIEGVGGYILRINNDGSNSPSWMDFGDMNIGISPTAASCSSGTCRFTSGSLGDLWTSYCPKTSGNCTNADFTNGPTNIIRGVNYSWSIQALTPGEQYPFSGIYGGGVTFSCP